MAWHFSSGRLRQMRERKRMDVKQLALSVRKGEQTIRKYEMGDQSPSADLLGRLADVLDCSVADFYDGQPGCVATSVDALDITARRMRTADGDFFPDGARSGVSPGIEHSIAKSAVGVELQVYLPGAVTGNGPRTIGRVRQCSAEHWRTHDPVEVWRELFGDVEIDMIRALRR